MQEKMEILTQTEFFKRYPPAQRAIRIGGNNPISVIPIGRDIICDFCNDLVTEEIYLYSESYALCPKCGKKTSVNMLKEDNGD